MSSATGSRRQVIDRYFEGFRHSDHPQILECLTDDVVWDLPGFKHLEGKAAFDGEIENSAFVGPPTLDVDRVIEADDTIVVVGAGSGTLAAGDAFQFAFCDIFTFAGDLVSRVESYVVPLTASLADVIAAQEQRR